MDIQSALSILKAEIRRLESAIKVAEDPLPLVDQLATLHELRVAVMARLAAEV